MSPPWPPAASRFASAAPAVRAVILGALRGIGQVVAPARCAACDAPLPLPGGALFCRVCDADVAAAGTSVAATAAAVHRLDDGLTVLSTGAYDGALAAAVRRMKYSGRPDLAGPLGERLATVCRRWLDARPPIVDASGETSIVMVPVPLHPARLAERGFNQSALVAAAMARKLGVSFAPRALVRLRRTAEQAALPRRERLENVASAFAVREPLRGVHVVVVDDVVTTGATARACCAALSGAGAVVLAIAALARADRAHTTSPSPTRAP